jgi:hypothetical protein
MIKLSQARLLYITVDAEPRFDEIFYPEYQGTFFGMVSAYLDHSKDMRDMALHFEVIRDKQTIHSELLQSKAMGYQLAVCYRDDQNLNVKICNVMDIVQNADNVVITLRSESTENGEIVVDLETIESIYPIHMFQK